jgi:hypothetical protein
VLVFGTSLGPYGIGAQIGAGGMGEVEQTTPYLEIPMTSALPTGLDFIP